MIIKVNLKNQITIPKTVREKLNIKAGDRFLVDVQENILLLFPVPGNYTNYLQNLDPEIWKGVDTENYLNEERNAW